MTQDKLPDLMPGPLLILSTRSKIGPGRMLELLTLAQAIMKEHPESLELSELVRDWISKNQIPGTISTSPLGNGT
jgi:hypothetical protein